MGKVEQNIQIQTGAQDFFTKKEIMHLVKRAEKVVDWHWGAVDDMIGLDRNYIRNQKRLGAEAHRRCIIFLLFILVFFILLIYHHS